MNSSGTRLSPFQQTALVLLRILIGWHFLYEGYYKLVLPAWTSNGAPLARWTSEGYVRAASGPFAKLFQRMIDAGWTPWLDNAVKFGLLLVGLSLLLGLITRTGCWGALFLLTMFYLSGIPVSGAHQAGAEGAYLIVNKTLIEAAAVCALLAFDTGRVAGLDMLLAGRRKRAIRPAAAAQAVAEQKPAHAANAPE